MSYTRDRWARWLFLLGSIWAPVCLADSSCPNTVIVSGDEQEQVKELLKRQGIETTSQPNCPSTRVHLTQTPKGVRVDLEDTQGRKIERSVSSVAAAVAVIESWSHEELNEPLLFRALPTKAPLISWSAQDESIPYAFAQEAITPTEFTVAAQEFNRPSALSFSFLGGLGLAKDTGAQYTSQLGVSLVKRGVQVGLFTKFSAPSSVFNNSLNNPGSRRSSLAVCTVDTNNDGIIDASDCSDPTNPGDPSDPCAPDASGAVGPNCPVDPTTCKQDTNGDNVIDASDCSSTTASTSGYSLGFGAGLSVPVSVRSVVVTPGLELGGAYQSQAIGLRGGVSLTTSTKIREGLSLDLRLALDSALQGAACFSTGLGLHWNKTK